MAASMEERLSGRSVDLEPLLAGVRRLTAVADRAGDADAVFRTLAAELARVAGAEEVHVHQLAGAGAPEPGQDRVAVYLFGAQDRLSYLQAASERAPGIARVASEGKPLLAVGPGELASSEPRVGAMGGAGCALLVPVIVRGEAQAVVLLLRHAPHAFDERERDLANTLIEQAATASALVRARVEAGTDALTGAMNRRAMHRRLQEEIARAARGAGSLSCMLIDLDNFKLVNDRHGHGAGDVMLRAVAQALLSEFRAFDRVARYGGDEFVVILAEADLAAATAAADRALERLRAISDPETGAGVAASIGVAQWHSAMTPEELLRSCDEALLRSKRAGKGRVTRVA